MLQTSHFINKTQSEKNNILLMVSIIKKKKSNQIVYRKIEEIIIFLKIPLKLIRYHIRSKLHLYLEAITNTYKLFGECELQGTEQHPSDKSMGDRWLQVTFSFFCNFNAYSLRIVLTFIHKWAEYLISNLKLYNNFLAISFSFEDILYF